MRALVTRPRDDAQTTADLLRARGFDVMVEPLLDIVPVDGAVVEADGIQGILATSANGIRALARVLADRSLPVWAVGDSSARVARALGYANVESAGGDVETLAALVIGRVDPAKGALLHAAAGAVAGDLAGRLGAAGFAVRRVVLYDARTATGVSAELADALRTQSLDAALFFSPRTAATFATLVGAAGLDPCCRSVAAYALSAAVARELGTLPWRWITVAPEPTQAALLAALDDDTPRLSAADPRPA
ncbi:MAG: uroporphyrinogen-III synthase [Magnetospirillum sp.]|nr:uroporphyrinogen-III synthase [Magnetospirillum sp.]